MVSSDICTGKQHVGILESMDGRRTREVCDFPRTLRAFMLGSLHRTLRLEERVQDGVDASLKGIYLEDVSLS
jgi:hypothetical protein